MNDNAASTKKLVAFECTVQLAAKIKQAAQREDRSTSAWLRNAARQVLDEQATPANA